MTESECHSAELQVSGGFRIEISPDELTVTEAKATNKYFQYLLSAVFISYLTIIILVNHASSFWILLLVAAGGLWGRFTGVHNVQCTREMVEVTDILFGRVKRTTYARTEVKEVRFGTVSVARYGSVNGLIFEVAGKPIKTLYGLRSIEAQRILDELQRLGFNVYSDPGMPMMVDIEKSLRKSKFFS
jgi:hypothetical protein